MSERSCKLIRTNKFSRNAFVTKDLIFWRFNQDCKNQTRTKMSTLRITDILPSLFPCKFKLSKKALLFRIDSDFFYLFYIDMTSNFSKAKTPHILLNKNCWKSLLFIQYINIRVLKALKLIRYIIVSLFLTPWRMWKKDIMT